eukprot:gb/GECH01004594.1/.p1 GENE.gb/GECH01004594.1/~~gb/GECH01004594.1/.p1  ORF type:complete len:270 (+),score=87.44 gb/GECH01004594.1/:1-810(+)
MKLTETLVMGKTKIDNIRVVKHLNVWGNDLDDVSVLREMPSLEVLSLSKNRISSLKDFAFCKNLSELYLRKNEICFLSELDFLASLPRLKILWLSDNPCSDDPQYREKVVAKIPNLERLDDEDVTPEERRRCKILQDQGKIGGESQTQSTQPSLKQNQSQQQQQQPSTELKPQIPSQRNYSPQIPSQQFQESPSESSVRQDNNRTKWEEPGTLLVPRARSPSPPKRNEEITKNNNDDNVLSAVLMLVRELDGKQLKSLQREVDYALARK